MAAIEFILIILDVAHWNNVYHRPSPVDAKPIKAYLEKDEQLIADFLRGLRNVHVEHNPLSQAVKYSSNLFPDTGLNLLY